MVVVVAVISRHGPRIKAQSRSQPNKSKLALFKPQYISNRAECFSQKGQCDICGHIHIEAFRRGADLGCRKMAFCYQRYMVVCYNHVCYSRSWILLSFHESEVKPRRSVITKISYDYYVINGFYSITTHLYGLILTVQPDSLCYDNLQTCVQYYIQTYACFGFKHVAL